MWVVAILIFQGTAKADGKTYTDSQANSKKKVSAESNAECTSATAPPPTTDEYTADG